MTHKSIPAKEMKPNSVSVRFHGPPRVTIEISSRPEARKILAADLHDPILDEPYRQFVQHDGFVISPNGPATVGTRVIGRKTVENNSRALPEAMLSAMRDPGSFIFPKNS